MEVGRSQASGAFRAHERYREAMSEILQQTRARVRASREKALEVGRELSERRTDERDSAREAEKARVRNQVIGSGGEDEKARLQGQARAASEAEKARLQSQVRGAGGEDERPERAELPGRPARVDRVDISEASREVLARLGNDLVEEEDAEVRPKVERLKDDYRQSKLFSPERLERAAERLLSAAAEFERNH